VFKDCIMVDPMKIEVIRGWARHTLMTELRNFIGLEGHMSLVEGFSTIAVPLT